MKTVICTLFEHHYQYGLAVFVNSLCASGYKGKVYAGFRGDLPPWAASKSKTLANGLTELPVTSDVTLIFMPLKTTAHLTNYKPEFMLQVEAMVAAESDALIYCDPDIVVDANWNFVDDWLTCGVAVCEDVNSPVPEFHPTRVGWRRFFKQYGYNLQFQTTAYANGGFVGLTWEHRKILPIWQEFMTHIATLLGSSNVAGIGGGEFLKTQYGFADCFSKTDQDALNALVEACPDVPFSFLGREAMAFQAGRCMFPHALGAPKPWKRQYLKMALSGIPPSKVDKVFWNHVSGPITPFTNAHVSSVRAQLAICAAMGRFIRRAS